MNKYFHEFTPGFNWVYIIAPAMLVLYQSPYKGFNRTR